MYKVIVCTILGNPVNNYYDQEVSKERMYTWKCIPRNRKPQLTLMRVTNSYRAVNQNFIEFISSSNTETINSIREMNHKNKNTNSIW